MSEHLSAVKDTDTSSRDQITDKSSESLETNTSEANLFSLPGFAAATPVPPPPPSSNGNKPKPVERSADKLQKIQSSQARQKIFRQMQKHHGNAFASQVARLSNDKPKPAPLQLPPLVTPINAIQRCSCNKCDECNKVARILDNAPKADSSMAVIARALAPLKPRVPTLPKPPKRPQISRTVIRRKMAIQRRSISKNKTSIQRKFAPVGKTTVQRTADSSVALITPTGDGMTGEEMQELLGMGLPAEVESVPADPAQKSSGGGGGSAIADKPESPMPNVAGSEPDAAIAALASVPAAQLPAQIGGVNSSVGTFVGKKTSEFQADPPQIKRPSGNPGESASLGGGDGKNKAPIVKETPGKMPAAEKGNDVPTQPLPPLPKPGPNPVAQVGSKSFPAAPPPARANVATTGDADKDAAASAAAQQEAERQRQARIAEIVQQVSAAISSLPTKDSSLNTKPGDPPKLKTEGNANPENVKQERSKLQDETTRLDTQGKIDAAEKMGEDGIFAKVPEETLKAKPQAAGAGTGTSGANAGAGGGQAGLTLPAGLTPKALSEITKEEKAGEISSAFSKAQADVSQEKQKQEQQVQEERQKADQDINKAIQENSQEQAKMRESAQQEVEKHRQDWTNEQNKVVDEQRKQADEKVNKALEDVENERKKGDDAAVKHLQDGEQKAEEERRKGEEKAEEERRKGEEKSQDKGWFDSIVDAASSFFDGIKKAIEDAFEAARKAVQTVIDAAKKLATEAIELARKAVVGLISAVGDALIAIGNVVLAAFPELKEKFTKFIRDSVDKATKAVNDLADKLKEGVQKLLDLLGAAILKGLDLLKQGLLMAVDALKATVTAVLQTVQALVQAYGDIMEIISHIAADPGGWIGNLGAAVKSGFINHFPDAMAKSLQDWFNGKVTSVTGLEPNEFHLLGKIGFTMGKIAETAWSKISGSLPMIVAQELLTRLATMLIPAAGTIMAIVQGVQAAISSAGQFIKSLSAILGFLKAVKGGNAGPAFANALASGVVFLIEFVSSFIMGKLRQGAAKLVGAALKRIFGKALSKIDMQNVRRQLKAKAEAAAQMADIAESEADTVQTVADNAQAKADPIHEQVKSLDTQVTVKFTLLEGLVGLAQSKQAEADTAQEQANIRQTEANGAQQALQQAQSEAANAQQISQQAQTDAQAAEQAATAKQMALQQAQSQSQAAQQQAQTAQQAAQAAESEATAARQEAENKRAAADAPDADPALQKEAEAAEQNAEAKEQNAKQLQAQAQTAQAEYRQAQNTAQTVQAEHQQAQQIAQTKAQAAQQTQAQFEAKQQAVQQAQTQFEAKQQAAQQATQQAQAKATEADAAVTSAMSTQEEADKLQSQLEQLATQAEALQADADAKQKEADEFAQKAETLRMAANTAESAYITAGGKPLNHKEKKPKKKGLRLPRNPFKLVKRVARTLLDKFTKRNPAKPDDNSRTVPSTSATQGNQHVGAHNNVDANTNTSAHNGQPNQHQPTGTNGQQSGTDNQLPGVDAQRHSPVSGQQPGAPLPVAVGGDSTLNRPTQPSDTSSRTPGATHSPERVTPVSHNSTTNSDANNHAANPPHSNGTTHSDNSHQPNTVGATPPARSTTQSPGNSVDKDAPKDGGRNRNNDENRVENPRETGINQDGTVNPEAFNKIKDEVPDLDEATFRTLSESYKRDGHKSGLSEQEYMLAMTKYRAPGVPIREDGGWERGQLTDQQFTTLQAAARRKGKPIYLCGSMSETNLGIYNRYSPQQQPHLPWWRQTKPTSDLIDKGAGDFDVWAGSNLSLKERYRIASRMGIITPDMDRAAIMDILDDGYNLDRYPNPQSLTGGALVFHPDGSVGRVTAEWQDIAWSGNDDRDIGYYRKKDPETGEGAKRPIRITQEEWAQQQIDSMNGSREKRDQHNQTYSEEQYPRANDNEYNRDSYGLYGKDGKNDPNLRQREAELNSDLDAAEKQRIELRNKLRETDDPAETIRIENELSNLDKTIDARTSELRTLQDDIYNRRPNGDNPSDGTSDPSDNGPEGTNPPDKTGPAPVEIEPGVVGKTRTEDGGHDIKVLANGKIVRCSDCADVRANYSQQLKDNPHLDQELSSGEKLATKDPVKAAEIGKKVEAALRKLQEAGDLGLDQIKTDLGQTGYDSLETAVGPNALRRLAETLEPAEIQNLTQKLEPAIIRELAPPLKGPQLNELSQVDMFKIAPNHQALINGGKGAAARNLPSFDGKGLSLIESDLRSAGFIPQGRVRGQDVWTHADQSVVRIKLEPHTFTGYNPGPHVVKEISSTAHNFGNKDIIVKVADNGEIVPAGTNFAQQSLSDWFRRKTGNAPTPKQLSALMEVWGKSGHVDITLP